MAYLAWKQNVGIENLDAEKAKDLLKTFRYQTSIDDKGKLRINCGASDIKLGFEPHGASTAVGVTSTPMKPWAFILFLIFIFIFVVPGFIFAMILSFQRRKIFIEAVQVMNQNVSNSPKLAPGSTDVSAKLSKLKEMKDQGIITEEEFNKKKTELIEKL